MKKISFFILIAAFICMTPAYAQKGTKKPSIKTELDSLSYAYGAGIVEQGLEQYLKQLGVVSDTTEAVNKKNITAFKKGINAFFAAKTKDEMYNKGFSFGSQLSQMSDNFGQITGNEKDQMNVSLFLLGLEHALNKESVIIENPGELIQNKYTAAQDKIKARREEEAKVKYASNIEAEKEFFAENKNKEGVISLPNGLQYKVITEGNGPIPTTSDKVKVHYHGTLLDGTVFDSSVDRGAPVDFGVTQVIKGWTEILQIMPVGSKWIVYIPAELAYGSRESGPIQPYSALIFEIELIDIEGNTTEIEVTPVEAE
ncbi:FKBP-type peptidyl-prolyl cis-trans isomerase [Dysgonomonas sp. 520]|uniref:FKBP-type peptidyl-prolyl cis-trans isomerase n=1 Tax=Dysgonomonas sp. 520 TaxID=2302931 RepID=UPI0013CFF01C|nr:FKBP-type peptidyl-prolyl cis-trans isomerase [Dysgonomonas sp. 520]NDW09978.1 FKBP-type peptidyl-prolyl cis-trans isomerase [Dysgonomonas sp. 520]